MASSITHWLDTNEIIYLLTEQDPSKKADMEALIDKAEAGEVTLGVDSVVMAECVWVLTGRTFGLSKQVTAQILSDLIESDGVQADDETVLLEALNNFHTHNIDFVDAFLAARARASLSPNVVTDNGKDFINLGINVLKPSDV